MRFFQPGSCRRLTLIAILAAVPAAAVAPPTITQAFGVATMAVGATTSLVITLTNSITTVPVTGVTFSDGLPTGLVVSTPNVLTNTCGGVVIAAAGSASIALIGGTIPAISPDPDSPAQTCVISVNVTATGLGVLTTAISGPDSDFGPPFATNGSITVTAALPATPAPATWTLLGIGMLALAGWRLRESRLRRGSSSHS